MVYRLKGRSKCRLIRRRRHSGRSLYLLLLGCRRLRHVETDYTATAEDWESDITFK
jgi:hypothetical protein